MEEAVIQQAFDKVLTCDCLSRLLDEVRSSLNSEALGKALVEGRQHLRGLDRVINGLVDAIEQNPSTALMVRLADRERERDEILARVAALETKRTRHENAQLDPRALDT